MMSSFVSTGDKGLSTLRSTQNAVKLISWHQQLLLARSRAIDIDGWEDALVPQFAVQVDFHIAGAFELFKDHVVHAASSVYQGRGDDRQAAAFFHVARRAKEALGPLQGV